MKKRMGGIKKNQLSISRMRVEKEGILKMKTNEEHFKNTVEQRKRQSQNLNF